MAEAQFLFRIFRGFGNPKIYKHCFTIFPLEKASLFFFYQSCFNSLLDRPCPGTATMNYFWRFVILVRQSLVFFLTFFLPEHSPYAIQKSHTSTQIGSWWCNFARHGCCRCVLPSCCTRIAQGDGNSSGAVATPGCLTGVFLRKKSSQTQTYAHGAQSVCWKNDVAAPWSQICLRLYCKRIFWGLGCIVEKCYCFFVCFFWTALPPRRSRKALLPMLFAAAWKLLEWAGAWESDQCFRRFLKTKATSCMNSIQQHVQMTTWLESVAVWAPFAPLVGVSITAAVATNFLLFDFAVAMQVPLLTDRNNLEASLSRAYFHKALISSWAFQVWHAFSCSMQGRFMLLPMGIVVLLPKDTWFDVRKIEALWAAIRPRQRRPIGESEESEALELRELGNLGWNLIIIWPKELKINYFKI